MKRKKEEERDIATQALTIMKELAEGICETRLIRALDMTEESAKDGLETWVETALSELAVENEINDECDELALAMEESLRQSQDRAAAAVPLVQQPLSNIVECFEPTSSLLSAAPKKVWRDNHVGAFFDNSVNKKDSLIRYLMLEQRCRRWWPQSIHYFDDTVQQFFDRCVQKGNMEKIADRILDFIIEEIHEIEAQVYAFPKEETSGDRGPFIPSIFQKFNDVEVVLCLDDEDALDKTDAVKNE